MSRAGKETSMTDTVVIMHSAGAFTEERLRRIEWVTDTSLAYLESDDLLRELLARVRDVLEADAATVLLIDAGGEELIATAAVGLEDAVRQGVRVPVGRGFAGAVAAGKRALVVDHVTDALMFSPALRKKGIRSLAGAPMLANGQMVGVLCVGAFTEHHFGESEAHLVQIAADRIASASQLGSSRAERIAATVLQHSLLPSRLPVVEGVSIDSRYVAGAENGIGGDWYDVFALPSGRVGIVMGDVVGHGLFAAVVMGRLRSALRAYALDDDNPARVLHRLDRKMTHFEPDAMATVAYSLYDPQTGALAVSLAGHLAPVIAGPGQPQRYVDAPTDPPVGVEVARRPRRTVTVEVPEEGVVCFYTDGLIERFHQPIDVGLEALRNAVVPGPAKEVCNTLMTTLVGNESFSDDITLLVLSRQLPAPVLEPEHLQNTTS